MPLERCAIVPIISCSHDIEKPENFSYYGFIGQAAEQRARAIPSTPDVVKGAIQFFVDMGADELVLWPCIPDLDQVDRLVELVG